MKTKHIKMFAEALPIQERWKPEVGDRCCTTIKKKPYFLEAKDLGYIRTYPQLYIFLPSIEQMAEMVANPLRKQHRHMALLDDFYLWVSTEIKHNQGWPMNILWLAYVMQKLYSLTWSKEAEGEWIKG